MGVETMLPSIRLTATAVLGLHLGPACYHQQLEKLGFRPVVLQHHRVGRRWSGDARPAEHKDVRRVVVIGLDVGDAVQVEPSVGVAFGGALVRMLPWSALLWTARRAIPAVPSVFGFIRSGCERRHRHRGQQPGRWLIPSPAAFWPTPRPMPCAPP